ncbi:MAG: hypothetical protein Q7T86_14165 [Hyphomicrobiaceae bacterium]|jgi:hypothetical protein|nr:hypothetical protein [Hyphomicrobiaceae bacterium]
MRQIAEGSQTQPNPIDPALLDVLEIMALRSRGRQTRNIAIWLAPPRVRAGR